MRAGPKTVAEFMALPEVGLYDTETYITPNGITHHRPIARKAVAIMLDSDTIFSVTDPNTGDLWVLHGEGRRRI